MTVGCEQQNPDATCKADTVEHRRCINVPVEICRENYKYKFVGQLTLGVAPGGPVGDDIKTSEIPKVAQVVCPGCGSLRIRDTEEIECLSGGEPKKCESCSKTFCA